MLRVALLTTTIDPEFTDEEKWAIQHAYPKEKNFLFHPLCLDIKTAYLPSRDIFGDITDRKPTERIDLVVVQEDFPAILGLKLAYYLTPPDMGDARYFVPDLAVMSANKEKYSLLLLERGSAGYRSRKNDQPYIVALVTSRASAFTPTEKDFFTERLFFEAGNLHYLDFDLPNCSLPPEKLFEAIQKQADQIIIREDDSVTLAMKLAYYFPHPRPNEGPHGRTGRNGPSIFILFKNKDDGSYFFY